MQVLGVFQIKIVHIGRFILVHCVARLYICVPFVDACNFTYLGPVYIMDHEVEPWMAFFYGPTSWSNFHAPISSKMK
jgi:hypothetical protein